MNSGVNGFTRYNFVLGTKDRDGRTRVHHRGSNTLVGYVWEASGKGAGWWFALPGRDHRQGDRSRGPHLPPRPFTSKSKAIMGMAAKL